MKRLIADTIIPDGDSTKVIGHVMFNLGLAYIYIGFTIGKNVPMNQAYMHQFQIAPWWVYSAVMLVCGPLMIAGSLIPWKKVRLATKAISFVVLSILAASFWPGGITAISTYGTLAIACFASIFKEG